MFELKIHNLKFFTIIGCYPEERVTPQELRVDVTLQFDAHIYHHQQTLVQIWDYVGIKNFVTEILQKGEFLFLESAGIVLSAQLFNLCSYFTDKPAFKNISLTFCKTGIFNDGSEAHLSYSQNHSATSSVITIENKTWSWHLPLTTSKLDWPLVAHEENSLPTDKFQLIIKKHV